MLRQAVVLVGGMGTRLGALTADTAKPMLPVQNEPFLDILLRNIARYGFDRILLLARHGAQQIHDHYADQHISGASVTVFEETAPAGTGGALREAAHLLDETFLLTNGDSLFDVNYLALLESFVASRSTVSLALNHVDDIARYGHVSIDADGKVTRYAEKSAPAGTPGTISGGVYIVSREILSAIPASGMCSLETDVMPGLVEAGRVSGREFQGYFLDIGLPESYAQAQTEIPAWEPRKVVFLDRDGTLNHDDGYTHKIEDLRFLPNVPNAIRRINDSGRLAIVVTNQGGIGRGLYGPEAVEAFHAEMNRRLQSHGAHIDAFYFSPYHPEGVIPELAVQSDCRKPGVGMLRSAVADRKIDLDDAVLIGDSQRDLDAAHAFGIKGLHTNGTNILQLVEGIDL